MMSPCVEKRLGSSEKSPSNGFLDGAVPGYGATASVGASIDPGGTSRAVGFPRMKHVGSRFSRLARGTAIVEILPLAARWSGSATMHEPLTEHEATTSF